MPHRQRQQVSVGDVRRAQHLLPVNGVCIQWVDVVRPERVHGVTQGLLQTGNHGVHGQTVRVSSLREYAHTAVQRDGATGPARCVGGQPLAAQAMVNMVGIQQRNQHTGVEQGAQFHSPISSRMARTMSLVTMCCPGAVSGRKP